MKEAALQIRPATGKDMPTIHRLAEAYALDGEAPASIWEKVRRFEGHRRKGIVVMRLEREP